MSTNIDDDAERFLHGDEELDESMEDNLSRKEKNELKKAHEREVRSKLSKLLEKKRLRNEFDNIDGWV